MKLAVFNPVLYSMSLADSLKYLKSIGVDCMELGCGGCPGTKHADAKVLSKDKNKLKELKAMFADNGVSISALSVHGNPVHPDKNLAAKDIADFEAALDIASTLNVDRIVTFSGCPGDKTSTAPNWVTCAWPTDFANLLTWQWEEVLIPYWKKAAKQATDAGVKHICFEMHPGFNVYNPETLLRLRTAVGDVIAANFDPSHLFWQGIDPVKAIYSLGGAIQYFHAKDTAIHPVNTAINGVLDTKTYADEKNRAWVFRTVGYGHDEFTWKNIFSALQLVGYDYVASIEHEDSLMTPKEGLEKAVKFLKNVMIFEDNKTEAWWI